MRADHATIAQATSVQATAAPQPVPLPPPQPDEQSVINADGSQITTSNDGRTTTIREAGGKTTTITADENGRVTITDNGKTTTIGAGPWSGVVQRLIAQRTHPIVATPAPFPPSPREQIPDGIVPLVGIIFGMIAATIVGLPIARAYARRMDRKAVATQTPPEVTQRLDRIEQAIESMAEEVERVSEAQRYSARLLTERLPEAPARAIAGAEHAR